ncbi:MAG: DUF4331 family protein [Vicinamibacteria bacterium]
MHLARGARAAVVATALLVPAARAADHLDTPTVIADPAADIGDLFAWTSTDGRRLNLAMTVVAHRFSDRLQYVFHVDSGRGFGATTDSRDLVCTFDAAGAGACALGDDRAQGDAGRPEGLASAGGRFRVFAGLRDDPFFNNVKGTRAALNRAASAFAGAPEDAAGCPRFDAETAGAIRELWRRTDGGPAANFLAGWKSAALVASVDLDAVAIGGTTLAIWASVHRTPDGAGLGPPVERIGRPLTANALVGPLASDQVSDRRKEEYNRAAPAAWSGFALDIAETLALYDAFDGVCGNQWAAGRRGPAPYRALADVLADDRLWVDSTKTRCRQFLAVELGALGAPGPAAGDCGGRTPAHDVDVLRSLLVSGTTTSIDDGIDLDDADASASAFPFLAVPR